MSAPRLPVTHPSICVFCRISELIERETGEYHKADPDPFDDRHPGYHPFTFLFFLEPFCHSKKFQHHEICVSDYHKSSFSFLSCQCAVRVF